MHPCITKTQTTHKICFNDDALIALLPKVVCFVKYFSVVYVNIILCDQLIRKMFLSHLINWNCDKSKLLLYLFEHILNHMIFVSLLVRIDTTEKKGVTIEEHQLWEQ